MRNSQRFEGLEEDEITWYSNTQKYTGNNEFGLKEGKITWYSNASFLHKAAYLGLEGSKLQGAQTSPKSLSVVRKQNYMMLKPCIR